MRGAFANGGISFELDPQRAVHRQGEKSGDADEDGVPIEDAGVVAEAEIGPQGFEEVAAFIERNAAHDVAECRTEKDGQEKAGSGEQEIPEGNPDGTDDVIAKFDGSTAQNKQPQDHH